MWRAMIGTPANGMADPRRPRGFEYIRLDWNDPADCDWLRDESELDPETVASLLEPYTRARAFATDRGHWVVTLRAIEPAPDADQLASVRLYISSTRVIAITRATVSSLDQLIEGGERQRDGSISSTRFLILLCERLEQQYTDALIALQELIDDLEDRVELTRFEPRDELRHLRLRLSRLRRHLQPQRDALQQLQRLAVEQPLESNATRRQRHANQWREIQNAFARNLELLHELSERLQILQDFLRIRADQQINRTMYLLTLATTFFLPFTFVASLLGMNVPGIPGADQPLGFWRVCGFIAIIAALQGLLIRRWRLLNR